MSERLNDWTKKSSRNIGLEHCILSLFSKRRTSVNERKNWEIDHDNEFGRKRPSFGPHHLTGIEDDMKFSFIH